MILFLVVTILTLFSAFFAEKRDSHIGMVVSALALALYSGLRGPSVGIDTYQYYFFYDEIWFGRKVFGVEESFISFCDFLQNFSSDPALLVFVMSFLTNILIVLRLWTLRSKSSFFIMIAVYLAGYYPESMNIMRQFFAVALVFFGSYFLEKNKPLFFIPFIVAAINMHTSAIVGFLLLFMYLWTAEGKERHFRRLAVALLFIPAIIVGSSGVINAYEMYSRYFETTQQKLGLMLLYKITGVFLICYVSVFGFNRTGSTIIGLHKLDFEKTLFYVIGIVLCSLGMFFPYMDRIGLYFLMFEMPFWGGAIKSQDMALPYRGLCFIFILYLFVMTLLTDGHRIFPYVTIFG